MSAPTPTARELIAQPHGLACDELSARVEAVLARCQRAKADSLRKPADSRADAEMVLADQIERLLDGEQP